MKHMYKPSFNILISKEGGYTSGGASKHDPGLETAWGVSRRWHPNWEGWEIIDDLKITGLLTQDRAWERLESSLRKFYKEEFWDKMKCDELPAGVDVYVFDMAVNPNPLESAKILQEAVGARQDGAIGPKTIAAVNAIPAAVVLDKLMRGRLHCYAMKDNDSNKEAHINGWINRSLDVYSLCLQEV